MNIFVIPDKHYPWSSKAAHKKTLKLIKDEKPDVIIQLGDLLDFYMFSHFTRTMYLVSPEKEVRKGLKQAKSMWEDLQNAAPNAAYRQLLGNHCVRMQKRIAEKLPELSSLVSIQQYYDFEGVTVARSDRDHLEYDGVIYTHGFLSKSIEHAKHYNKPVVHGHLHRPGIDTFGRRLWSMDCGHNADTSALPLNYGASKIKHWRMAAGRVRDAKPQLYFLE